jgi:hypothetical protein
MSFLSRLFGFRAPSASRDVEAELSRLEREAKNARPGYVGSAYNRAGDLAMRSGKPDRAMQYYGSAIDAFLEDSQREAARGVANKIVRVRPTAVRTLCTLTWLDLSARHDGMALRHLVDYVEAASRAGEEVRAATQIYRMARISAGDDFLEGAADALERLGYLKRASEVRGWIEGGAPDAIHDEEALSSACVRAAIESAAQGTELITDDGAPEITDEEADEDAGARAGP